MFIKEKVSSGVGWIGVLQNRIHSLDLLNRVMELSFR